MNTPALCLAHLVQRDSTV